jgi:hypothetical protein
VVPSFGAIEGAKAHHLREHLILHVWSFHERFVREKNTGKHRETPHFWVNDDKLSFLDRFL